MTRKSRKEVSDEAKGRIHEGSESGECDDLVDNIASDEEISPSRGTTCSLFALSVILFNVTACLIVWWFVFGR